MNEPETKETLVKQEPRVSIKRKEVASGESRWDIEVSAPLDVQFADLIERIYKARLYAIGKDKFITNALPTKEESK